MSLLVLSQSFIGAGPLPYLMLLLATTSLGIGFGLTVPALNKLRGGVLPAGGGPRGPVPQRAAGPGHGARAGPRGGLPGPRAWWGLPAAGRRCCWPVLIAVSLRPAAADRGTGRRPGGRERAERRCRRASGSSPAFALLYGVVETTNGNWATLYMTAAIWAPRRPWRRSRSRRSGAWSRSAGSLFAAIERAVPGDAARTGCCRSSPPPRWPRGVTARRARRRPASLAFGLAGLGCSALLPLTISFGQRELVASALAWRAC